MNPERVMAFKECAEICREIIRRYKFEDDIAYGARLCLDDIEKQMRALDPTD